MADRTAEQRGDPVEQLRARVRAAFDGEDVPRKNIALRIAWDALRKLRDERDEARAALARSEAERERLRDEMKRAQSYAASQADRFSRLEHSRDTAAMFRRLDRRLRAALRSEP